MVRRAVAYLDRGTGASPALRKVLRYAFPDHWSFLLGEVALYSFIVLVGTGIYLTLFFEPSLAKTTYNGVYAPLRGMEMSQAYKSVVDISYERNAGLLFRQTHHWAADVFVASVILHLMRVFFTGAFRRPRTLIWTIGLLMLFTSLLEGYLGYSMVDDLLSGMGLAIGYGVALSTPIIGGNLGLALWGGPYPGVHAFESRMYIAHVLLFPALIATLIALHLALVMRHHHTQFPTSPRATERRVIGLPTFPGQTPRSLGLLLAVSGVLLLLGGLVQINPIWLWGPYHVADGTNGAQPDWYLGWLIGALRLVPSFDVTIGNYTLVPNPFWGGILFPGLIFTILGIWPFAERRLTGDRRFHNVLDRPRDAPWRTALGSGVLTWVLVVFFAGSMDRVYLIYGLDYNLQVWIYRGLIVFLPPLVVWLVHRVCVELKQADEVEAVRRTAEEEAAAA
ncbi:MAG TPA: cytochrome b N-terminal domain-containing protein [Gaiellales bacterium]|nr:cytochrome b N-terminal domain-containing protein [Gaiellales bacterium]